MDTILKLTDVSKVFNPGTVNEKQALKNINLEVKESEIVCVIGSNGSGKSTLFNLIGGTFPVTSGKIEYMGKDITDLPEYKRAMYMGRVFQDPNKGTSANMSVEDNLLVAEKKGMRSLKVGLNDKKRAQYRELLKQINLSERLRDNVGLLSGGQRQALTLMMMVMSNPRLVLLDEHTAALDPANADNVMALTQKYIEQYNLTAFMVTHNMQFAIDYGTRLIMMDQGEIILDVSGEEKQKLTVSKLVSYFKKVKNKSFDSDRDLLSV